MEAQLEGFPMCAANLAAFEDLVLNCQQRCSLHSKMFLESCFGKLLVGRVCMVTILSSHTLFCRLILQIDALGGKGPTSHLLPGTSTGSWLSGIEHQLGWEQKPEFLRQVLSKSKAKTARGLVFAVNGIETIKSCPPAPATQPGLRTYRKGFSSYNCQKAQRTRLPCLGCGPGRSGREPKAREGEGEDGLWLLRSLGILVLWRTVTH